MIELCWGRLTWYGTNLLSLALPRACGFKSHPQRRLLGVKMNRRLHQDIVEKLEEKRKALPEGRNLENLAIELNEAFGVSRFTSEKIVQLFSEGSIYGENFGTRKRETKELEWLRRFAIYLNYIGVGPYDPIISYMRKFDPRFTYPIKSSSKKPRKQYVPK